jgi:hypothetical protein
VLTVPTCDNSFSVINGSAPMASAIVCASTTSSCAANSAIAAAVPASTGIGAARKCVAHAAS